MREPKPTPDLPPLPNRGPDDGADAASSVGAHGAPPPIIPLEPIEIPRAERVRAVLRALGLALLVLVAAGALALIVLAPAEFWRELVHGPDPVTDTATPEAAPATPAPAPTARLFVGSQPERALVVVGADTVGFTPVNMPGLSPGTYRVQVSMLGFRTVDTTLTLAPADSARLDLSLQRRLRRARPR